GGRSFSVDSSVSAFRIRHWRAACCCCGCSSPAALPVHSLARTIARSVQSTLPSTMSSTIPKYAHLSNNSVPLRRVGMGIGMGIIIVKTLQSHSPRLTIAPLRGPTHTRPGNLDLFFMKNCGVRGLSSHNTLPFVVPEFSYQVGQGRSSASGALNAPRLDPSFRRAGQRNFHSGRNFLGRESKLTSSI